MNNVEYLVTKTGILDFKRTFHSGTYIIIYFSREIWSYSKCVDALDTIKPFGFDSNSLNSKYWIKIFDSDNMTYSWALKEQT